MCPSSGENTVPMRHLVFVTPYRRLSGMQSGIYSALHTRQSSIWSDKYQVSHRYGIFLRWWAHSCPTHVQKRNKHIKKFVHQFGSIYKRLYEDERSTEHKTPDQIISPPTCINESVKYRGADNSLALPEWKNNWKVAIFRPTRRSLLPRRHGWTDNFLNWFWVACNS